MNNWKRLFLAAFFIASPMLFAADKTRIAVMAFVAKAGVDANTAATVAELLSGELVALKKFDVIDRANLDKIMREQALQQSGCSDQACAVKLGNILNVQKLVVGTVSKLGTKLILTMNFIDVERSRIEMSDNETAANEDDLMPRIKSLASRINQRISVGGRIVGTKEDGTYLINVGQEDGLAKGMAIKVMRYGNTIIDQGTGEFLGREVTDLGLASVIAVDVGGSLATIRPPKGSLPFKDGDRVVLALPDGNPKVPVEIGHRTPLGDRKPVMARPIVLISGLVLAVGGGGMTALSYVQADQAVAVYNNLGTNAAASLFTEKYNLYRSSYDLILPFAVVGGVGAALIVTSLLLPSNERTAWVVPTFDGERLGFTAFARF